MASLHPLMQDFTEFFQQLTEELENEGGNYMSVEIRQGTSETPQVRVWCSPMKEFVTGADPQDVLLEAKHRLKFTRQQSALCLPAPVEVRAVPAPEEEIPF